MARFRYDLEPRLRHQLGDEFVPPNRAKLIVLAA
jgi:hypothetical protein